MMNILRALSFAATLSAVCLVCGACSAPPMPADGQTVYEGEPREIFADDLRGEIEVGVPTMRRTPGNQLQVVVPLTNVARRDLRLLVQVQFLDELGQCRNGGVGGGRFNDRGLRLAADRHVLELFLELLDAQVRCIHQP